MDFKFKPLEYVTIIAMGVNYRGRVQRCILEHPQEQLFDVQYIDDKGDFKRGEYLADELSKKLGT